MTTNIQKSLYTLIDALSELETAATHAAEKQQKAVNSKQSNSGNKTNTDLFSFPDSNAESNKALASRLDGAIAKVEKLLQEA